MKAIFNIPEYRFTAFQAQFEKLQKKAEKLNLEPPTYKKLEEVRVKIEDYSVQMIKVLVEGETPKYQGWSFIALIDSSEGMSIIKGTPGEEVPEEYRNKGTICEHCNHKRFRNKVFILKHDSEEYKQVGSTCVKDFLGGDSPQDIAKYYEATLELLDSFATDPDFDSCPKTAFLFDTKRILAITDAMIKKYGWISRKKAEETFTLSTADGVIEYVFKGKPRIEISEDNIKEAEKALVWCQTLAENKKMTDYEYNILQLSQKENVSTNNFGFLCSIIPTYRRATAIKEDGKDFVGEIKKRYNFKVVVFNVSYVEGYYGLKTIVKMKTEDGNILTWFATNNPTVEVGKDYNIAATIKNHNVFNGSKETIVTRVKL
jgi:hypothetical protein